ncbi:MAG: TonB-dependent receptor plug domain-containing protein [Sphingomicrobium sp.]|nr:TonB-dependent receptor [Sphingomonadales bacterium]
MTSRLSRAILLASFSPLAFAAPAAAQQNQGAVNENVAPANARGETPDQSTIVVTGTRRTDRTVANSPVPVDVISADSLQSNGFTDTNKALTAEVPSFNFPQPSITDGTDVVRPATLRGLSPDQTLVLINGKRRHTSALLNINGSVGRGSSAVDINLIPSIALSRVEVLRDGAAAQYGSDAIAGVINFQLRNARSGGRFTATFGEYNTNVQGIQGYTRVQTGAANTPVLAPDGTLALNHTGQDIHRIDGLVETFAGVVGLPVFRQGYFDVAGEVQLRDGTNRTGADPRRQYNLIAGALDPRELTFNRFSHKYGDPSTTDGKLFVNLGAPISAGINFYGFGSFNSRAGQSGGFYRLANDARNVPAIYPDGFLPLINTDTKDHSATVGLRGDLGGFRWDLSAQTARDRVNFEITSSVNRSLGSASPTRFDSGGLTYGQQLLNLDVSKDIGLAFTSKTTISAGAEYRREMFQIRPGEPASYANGSAGGAPGAQVFPGFQPLIAGQRVDTRHKRNNKSLYAEIDSDFTSAFNVQGALRYEDYSDFGSRLSWKLASRFEPVHGFAIRASASTGLRAPSLQQQFYAAQATNNVNGVLLDTVTLPVSNPAAIALGATPLKAERSMSYSAGLVFSAVPRLNVTLDIYQVKIKDRIVVTENLSATRTAGVPSGGNPGFAIAQILNAAGFNTVNAARFFVNGIDTRTRGLDLVGTYRFPQGPMGRLLLTGGFNYNKTKITRNAAAPGSLATVPGVILFGRQESTRLTQGQPRTKINASADYDYSIFGVTVRATRYGKVLAAGTDLFGDVNLAAKTITDAEIRAKPFGDTVTFAIGGNNLFDVYPTNTPTGRAIDPATITASNPTGSLRNYPATNYVAPFSNFSPFGFNGRFLYARVAVKW